MALVIVHRDDGGMEMIADDAPTVGPLRAGASTSAGHRRLHNEDAYLCGPAWFAVADGIGGHSAGGVASRIAVEVLRDQPSLGDLSDLQQVVTAINDAVRDAARRDGTNGMGTTLVAVTPIAGGLAVVHIGDSRCYRLTAGGLAQLTHDHSHVQELVDLGHLTDEAARRHRLRNVITRALGIDEAPRPDAMFVPAPVGRVLLCSDGLTAHLGPRAIGRVLAGMDDPRAAADRLVELALRRGARDDVTAVVVEAVGDGS